MVTYEASTEGLREGLRTVRLEKGDEINQPYLTPSKSRFPAITPALWQ
jgi:hypothetical protein